MYLCKKCKTGMEPTIIIDGDGTHHARVCPKCGDIIKICTDESIFKERV